MFFDGVFSQRKRFKDILELILKHKNCTLDFLEQTLSKKKAISRKSLKEQLLELKRNGVLRETKFLSMENYYCHHPILYFLYRFGKEKPNYIQWRDDMFEIITAEHISAIMEQVQDREFDYRLNLQIKEEDLIANGSQRVMGQYDLIAEIYPKNRYYQNRNHTFVVFEVKFQENSISVQQREKLKHRAFAFGSYFSERKAKNVNVDVKSYFISATERSRANIINLPDLMLSLPED